PHLLCTSPKHSFTPDLPTFMVPTLAHFFLNRPATTEIYTLSLHDALPIYYEHRLHRDQSRRLWADQQLSPQPLDLGRQRDLHHQDRKSTRLNSSHVAISYAVSCLKKKQECLTRDRVRPSFTIGTDTGSANC